MRQFDNSVHRGRRAELAAGSDDTTARARLTQGFASQRVVKFLSRYLSRDDLVWFSLTLGISFLGVIAFLLLAYAVSQQSGLVELDNALSVRLHRHARDNPVVVGILRLVTALGSHEALIPFTIMVALVLSLRGRRTLSRVWLVVASGGLLHSLLKPIVPRLRPQFEDPFVTEASLSFPSGHAMASLIGYGLLAYLLWLGLRRRTARLGAAVLLGLLVLGIGFSRMYLGAHYLSDVLGGYAAGTAWLVASICGIETVRRNRQRVGH